MTMCVSFILQIPYPMNSETPPHFSHNNEISCGLRLKSSSNTTVRAPLIVNNTKKTQNLQLLIYFLPLCRFFHFFHSSFIRHSSKMEEIHYLHCISKLSFTLKCRHSILPYKKEEILQGEYACRKINNVRNNISNDLRGS